MSSFNLLLLASAISCLSYASVNIVRLHLKKHLTDIPNERSSHTIPTPRGGGIGFILAFAVGGCIYALVSPAQFESALPTTAWLSFLPLVFVGIIDDIKGVSASIRYGVQFVVACLLVWHIGIYPWPFVQELGTSGLILGFLLTAISITAFINFYNFMDGLDGLVAGCSFVQVLFLSIYLQEPIIGLLGAALLGFLYWNWSPAKIFMGDIGSTFLGAVIAAILLLISQEIEFGSLHGWGILSITFPIVIDALYTLIRRWKADENIFQAHRSHVYQRLQQAGLPHSKVAGAYVIATISMVLFFYYLGVVGALLNITLISLVLIGVEWFIRSRPEAIRSSLLAFNGSNVTISDDRSLDSN